MPKHIYVCASSDGFKIGYWAGTKKALESRYITSLPTSEIILFYPHEHAEQIEKRLHAENKHLRVRNINGNLSEVYNISIDDAITMVLKYSKLCDTDIIIKNNNLSSPVIGDDEKIDYITDDVVATAELIKRRQPKLYECLLNLIKKEDYKITGNILDAIEDCEIMTDLHLLYPKLNFDDDIMLTKPFHALEVLENIICANFDGKITSDDVIQYDTDQEILPRWLAIEKLRRPYCGLYFTRCIMKPRHELHKVEVNDDVINDAINIDNKIVLIQSGFKNRSDSKNTDVFDVTRIQNICNLIQSTYVHSSHTLNSYGFKHEIEKIIGYYVSNGEVILACKLLNIK